MNEVLLREVIRLVCICNGFDEVIVKGFGDLGKFCKGLGRICCSEEYDGLGIFNLLKYFLFDDVCIDIVRCIFIFVYKLIILVLKIIN